MNGLQMTVDPRWVFVTRGDDITAEVDRQLGVIPPPGAEATWQELRDDSAQLLLDELNDGAEWSALFMMQEADGSLVAARASARFEPTLTTEIGDLYDEILVAHRDDTYQATVQMIETPAGVAVQLKRLLQQGEEQPVEYHGYLVPSSTGGLLVECFCAPSGFAGAWGSSLESMVLSLRPDVQTATDSISLVMYVYSGSD